MKSVRGVVLLASLLALAQAFPGVPRDSDESTDVDVGKKDGVVVIVPNLESVFGSELGDDDDASMHPGFWNPFKSARNPFEDLITRMQETMNRVRAQMAAALASQLSHGTGLTPWGKIPEGANTTSTTKIIGGHVVTINETTYSDGDENGGVIFRVRVVDAKPVNDTTPTINGESSSEETSNPSGTRRVPSQGNASESAEDNDKREELTTPASRSVETVEEFDNEINNKNSKSDDNLYA